MKMIFKIKKGEALDKVDHKKIYFNFLALLFLGNAAFGGKILSKMQRKDSEETHQVTSLRFTQNPGKPKEDLKNSPFTSMKELQEQADPSEDESLKDSGGLALEQKKIKISYLQCHVEDSSEENLSGSEEDSLKMKYPLILKYRGNTKIISNEKEFLDLGILSNET